MAKYQKTQFVAQLKSGYATLSQAVSLMTSDYGCSGDLYCTGGFSTWNSSVGPDAIAKNLKVIKRYGAGQTADFFADSYTSFEGGTLDDPDRGYPWFDPKPKDFGYKYLLVDGSAIAIGNPTSHCTSTDSICASIMIDVNGKKPPNQTGRDLFGFGILGNASLYPSGGHKYGDINSWESTTMYNCTNPLKGDAYAYGCTGRIIEEGWQMNY